MEHLFFKIANEYGKLSDDKTTEFLEHYRTISKIIGTLPIQRDLTLRIVLCFSTNSIKESDWKIYKKLKPNAKVGFLSRKLLSIARKEGVNQIAIKQFIYAKDKWKFSKKYYSKDHKDPKYKLKLEKAVKKFYSEGKVDDYNTMVKDDEIHDRNHRNMYNQTDLFIDFILDKTIERISNEIEL